MGTTSQAIVTASLDGKSLGIFDTRSGGETTAEVTKYRPGGSKQQEVDAGRPDVSDVTISRRWVVERDLDVERAARNRAGVGIITITEQPTDVDGIAFGKPRTWTGRVSSATGGDYDSNSDDTRMLTITAVIRATV